MLMSQIAETLQVQQATFLTDCATLAHAAASQNMMLAPGHWSIRPQLAQIAVSTAFDASRIYHINRGYNFQAHHQAKLALKIQNASLNYRCLNSGLVARRWAAMEDLTVPSQRYNLAAPPRTNRAGATDNQELTLPPPENKKSRGSGLRPRMSVLAISFGRQMTLMYSSKS